MNHIRLLNVHLDLGDTKLELKEATKFLNCILFFVNNFRFLSKIGINYILPFFGNIFLYFYPLPMQINLIDKLYLDLLFVEQIKTVNGASVFYSNFEVYNYSAKSRAVVNPSYPLKDLKVYPDKTIELSINQRMFSTLLATLEQNNHLSILLTDKIVHSMTGFFHLRANNFIHYFPGIEDYGTSPLTLKLILDKNINFKAINGSHVQLDGKTTWEFRVEGKSDLLVKFSAEAQLDFTAAFVDKNVSAKLDNIKLTSLKFEKFIKKEPEADVIKKEFNGVFLVLVNAVNNYVLNKEINVEDILNKFGLFKFDVKNLNLQIDQQYMMMDATMTIS